MRILTRYIVRELTVVFLATLASMTIFIFLVLVGKEAVDNGLGLAPILRMLPYMLPQAMQFAVPGALLLAATSVYGRVSASNEVVAIKALGISPMTLIWPTVALSSVISLAAVVLNDVAVSWGQGGIDRVLIESLEEIAYGHLRTTHNFNTDRLKVYVEEVQGHQLINPIIQISPGEGRLPSVISADAAELHADAKNNVVTIKLVNADGNFSGWSISHPGEFERSFPAEEFTGGKHGERSPSYYALSEIGPTKLKQADRISNLKHAMEADVGAALLTGNFEDLAMPTWPERQTELIAAERQLHRLKTEPYRRWANGFSCLGFALIGVPMAIRRRHAEFWGSFFVCFLPILLVYYPMLVGCVDWAKDGVVPPPTCWLGNLVLAAWGAWLHQRHIRL
jgi:lipopolysaccharide export system permease protein